MFACKSVTVIVEYMECSNCERNTKNVEWRAAWNVFVCGLIFQLFFSPEYYSHCRCITVPWNYKINKLPQILDSWMAVLKLSLKFSPIFHWISQFFLRKKLLCGKQVLSEDCQLPGIVIWFDITDFSFILLTEWTKFVVRFTLKRRDCESFLLIPCSMNFKWCYLMISIEMKLSFGFIWSTSSSIVSHFVNNSIDEFIIHSQVLWSDSIDVHSLKLSSKYLNYNRFKRIRFAI